MNSNSIKTCFFIFFIGTTLLFNSDAQAQPNMCSQWVDCNLNLAADLNPVTEMSSNFVYDQESAHFVFFQQTDSPNYGNYDPTAYQDMIDHVECGYRYLICEVGLTAVSATDKYHIYVGDHPSSSATYQDYLKQADHFVTEPMAFDYIYSTLTHELFHKIQSEHYAYSIYQNLTEGLASLVEQLPSELNFSTALGKVGRSSAFTKPEDTGPYSYNVFLRYMFEQIEGPPPSPTDVNSDWAVRNHLRDFMDSIATVGANQTLATYLAAYLPTALTANSTVTSLDNLYDNFQVARYSYKDVDSILQPRAALQNKDMYMPLAWQDDLNLYSIGNIIDVGTIMTFDNSNVIYGYTPDFGFQTFLDAEYNILEPNLATVGRLRFEKTLYDDFIRFQLVIKDNVAGTVMRRKILRGTNTSQTLTIPANVTISEMALIVYTVEDSPVNTGNGKVYTMTVEGLTP